MLNITSARAWDSNRFIRDFDFFGYKFALLSSVGSAGLNSIINTLPARDAEEMEKFPQQDIKFIRDWLAVSATHTHCRCFTYVVLVCGISLMIPIFRC